MKLGILALQGNFSEHEAVLQRLGVASMELRSAEDTACAFDGLILPGGESTVQKKLLDDLGMGTILREKILAGLPVFATCAGLILLAQYFNVLPVTVRRNAYGRQLGSFSTCAAFGSMDDVPMRFIRAPYIEKVEDNVEILARNNGKITAVQKGKLLAMAFHPELTSDDRIFRYFLEDFVGK